MSTNNVDLQKALKSIFGFSAFKGKQEDIIVASWRVTIPLS